MCTTLAEGTLLLPRSFRRAMIAQWQSVGQRTDPPRSPPQHAPKYRMRVSLDSLSEADKEAARHERAVNSLHVRTGAPLVEVQRLFAQEFSRLELGAKVRSYLSVLTVRNVRAMLRRKGALSGEDGDARP